MTQSASCACLGSKKFRNIKMIEEDAVVLIFLAPREREIELEFGRSVY